MIKHLTEQQLIDGIYRALTDDQRAKIDQHLAGCPACRAELAEHQAVERRIRYRIIAQRHEAASLPQPAYAVIAPRVKRPSRAVRVRERLMRFSSGALATAVLCALAILLISMFGGARQATVNPLPTSTPTATPSASSLSTFTPTPAASPEWSIGDGADPLAGPSGLAVDAQGNLYAIDAGHDRIVKYDPNGKPLTQWGGHGQGDGQFFFGGVQDPPESGPFRQAYGKIAVDQRGNVYVADTRNARIQKFDSQGKFLLKWGSPGVGEGQFGFLAGIAIDSLGNIFTAENAPESRIQEFDQNGKFLLLWKTHPANNGLPFSPDDIAIDQRGYVYLLDRGSATIQRASKTGQWIDNWTLICGRKNTLLSPDSLTLDRANHLYVADSMMNQICKYDGTGQFLALWNTENGLGVDPSNLVAGIMSGIAIDAQSNVYISVSEINRILKFSQP
jgi:DNA-binding beta-propeller fold protein YncE